MNVAPDPVDVQDLQFKLQCRLNIFENNEEIPTCSAKNLVATASRFGLFFVGCNIPQLKVIRFASVEDYTHINPVTNYSRREVTLPSLPQYLSVNCDNTILAVVIEKDNCPFAVFYDVQSFVKQNVSIINEIRLSKTAGVKVLEASWHPTQSNIYSECKSDGTLGIYELKDKSVEIKTLPSESNASCFCWSPKGKQIAVGSKDGKLTHYKPDLKAVKVIPAPPFEKQYTIISLQWISNYQFIGAFKPIDSSEDQCCIVVIDAPKMGTTTYTNFYDVCYSTGNYRSPQFYLLLLQNWNIMVISSANSMECGILANANDVWSQWSLSDSARAELPLDENRSETFPIGISIDTSSVKPVPWGESSLQPMPSLLLLSHKGILCSFKIINLKGNTPSINSPPENIADLSGLGAFNTGNPNISKDLSTKQAELPPGPQKALQPKPEQPSIQQPKPPQIIQHPKPQQVIQSSQPQTTSQAQVLDPRNITQTAPTVFTQVKQSSVQSNPVKVQSQQMTYFSPQIETKSSGMNLFGGQVTITPTNKEKKPSTSSSLMGSMLLANLNSNKLVMDNPSINIKTNLKTEKETSAGVSNPSAQINKIESAAKIQKAPDPVNKKNSADVVDIKQTMPAEVNQKNNEDIEAILKKMTEMECSALDKELDIILFQGKQIEISLDAKDMDKIVSYTEDLEDFINELVETSDTQSSEVHILKQNIIQSWAWLEEAKSRLKEYQNEEIQTLMKSRPLDSVSEKHLVTLKQMEYYLDSQLVQAHKALDEQWDIFQEYCRKVNRIQLPTMEAIFQTMVKQNAVLQKHDYILKDISSQLKGKRRAIDFVPLFNPLNKLGSLDDSFRNLKLEADDMYHIYHQRVMNRVKPLPSNKSSQLRRMLHNREVPHVMVKSQMMSSILQKTPEKNKSILVQVTPISKQPEVAKKLNFYQSTPVNIKPLPLTTQLNSSPSSAFAPTNSLPQSASLIQKGVLFKTPLDAANAVSSVSSVPSISLSALTNSTQNSSDINSGSVAERQIPAMNFNANINSTPFSLLPQASSSNSAPSSMYSSQSVNTTRSILSSALSKPTAFTATPSNASTIKTSSLFEQHSAEKNSNIPLKLPISSASVSNSMLRSDTTISVSNICPSSVSFPQSAKTSFFTPITCLQASADLPISEVIYTQSGGMDKNVTTITSPIFGKTTFSGISMKSNQSELLVDAISSSNSVTPVTNINTCPEIISSGITSRSEPLASTLKNSLSFTTTTNCLSTSVSSQPVVSNTSSITFTPIVISPLESLKMTTCQPMFSSSAVSTTTSISSLPVVSECASSTSIPTESFIKTSSVTTSSKTDVFGTAPSTNAPFLNSGSLFGTVPLISSTSSSSGSLFGSISTASTTAKSPTSLFGAVPSNTVTSSPTSGDIFKSTSFAAPVSTATGSIFGVASTVAKPLFGTNTPQSGAISGNLFGAAPSSSIGTTSSGSVFSSSPLSVPKTSGNLFNNTQSLPVSSTNTGSFPITAPNTTGSIFGSKLPASSSEPSTKSIFSPSSVTSTSVSSNLFDSKSVKSTTMSSNSQNAGINSSSASIIFASTQSSSVFGTTSSASTNSPFAKVTGTSDNPNFGVTGTSTQNTGSLFQNDTKPIFGTAAQSTSNNSTNTSPFGSSLSTPTTFSSIFGNAFATGNSSNSSFGVPINSSSVGSPIFGTSTNSSFVSSPFGGAVSSAFGTTTTSTTPRFGTPSSTSFGGVTGNTSIFGQNSNSNSSPFGNPASSQPSVFGQTSVFGGNFGQTTSNSVFEQGTSNTSTVFGSPNVFGGTTTSTTFGGATTPFGATSSTSPFAQKSTFGSSPFGSAPVSENSGSSFGFGSLNVGSSAQSPFAKKEETKSPFGASNFNAAASTGSLFGSSGSVFGQSAFGSSSSFSSPQQSGAFSGGTGSSFGSAPSFQKPSGFGAQPSFGGTPAFGNAPTFGGAPTFGNTSPFGSPEKVFGSTSPTGVFGTNNQASPGFGNLANQNTIGFGNLAQQSVNNPNQNSPFSGGSSFSSWR